MTRLLRALPLQRSLVQVDRALLTFADLPRVWKNLAGLVPQLIREEARIEAQAASLSQARLFFTGLVGRCRASQPSRHGSGAALVDPCERPISTDSACLARGQPDETMSKPIVVSIPHSLGKEEALRRLKPGLSGAPVVLFVHGGGFVGGDKGNEGDPFFNNVGAWAARSGFIGVTMTYRLAPVHAWPSGAQDVDLALGWLRAHVATYGGNPARIVVMGHSAGAAHVAGCLARHGCAPGSRSPAAAVILVSGIYELDLYPDGHDYRVYFGADRRQDKERSTVAQLASLDIPSLFTISEFDPPAFHRNLAAVFHARVGQSGRCPEVLCQRGHNHVSVMMQLGSELDTAGNELAEFIRQLQ